MAPEHIVLEHLRAIRSDMAKTAESTRLMQTEMIAMRQDMAGVTTLLDHDHGDIAAIKVRPDRLGRRLKLAD